MSELPRNVMALGAHPDDIELLCAGTLARFLQAGSAVSLVVLCRGNRGGASPDLAGIRTEEAHRASAELGAPLTLLGVEDSQLRDTPELRSRLLGLFRTVRPDLIITHGPDDYHEDHVQLSGLAARCAWFAASPGHETPQPPLDRPPALVWMDNMAGMGSEPSHLVDITETMDLKRRLLACHQSQIERRDGGGFALSELMETLARLRGFQAGVSYAEGFRAPSLWGRRRVEPILP